MTMLTHSRSLFEPAPHSSARRGDTGQGAALARLAMIKRFYLCTLVAVLAGGAAAGMIALKTAIFFSRFHH
jgi:hypothetical protein